MHPTRANRSDRLSKPFPLVSTSSPGRLIPRWRIDLEKQPRQADQRIRLEVETQRRKPEHDAEKSLDPEAIAAIQQTEPALAAMQHSADADSIEHTGHYWPGDPSSFAFGPGSYQLGPNTKGRESNTCLGDRMTQQCVALRQSRSGRADPPNNEVFIFTMLW